jgi:hypothetical protein
VHNGFSDTNGFFETCFEHAIVFDKLFCAGCPEEHKGAMASWVTSCVLDGDAFAARARAAKKNADFEDNVFVCFSHTLEQHYEFEWLNRCFVSRLNPVVALKKLTMYASEGARTRPPLVVERPSGGFAIVTHESTRFDCSNSHEVGLNDHALSHRVVGFF